MAGAPTPPPPVFFWRHAGWFSKTQNPYKGVCKWGGPPTPRAFDTMLSVFQYQQELRQTRSCYGVLLSHHTGSLFANGGGCALPNPPAFFTPCRLVFKSLEPVVKVFANRGGCAPPPNYNFNSSNNNNNLLNAERAGSAHCGRVKLK